MIRLPATLLKAPGGNERSVSVPQTLRAVPELRSRIGITRIAELTRLHRSQIPAFAAIVPRSRQHISVFSGKGASRDEALVSAVMEAVERCTASAHDLRSRPLHACDVAASDVFHVLDLDALGVTRDCRSRAIRFVAATNLLDGDEVLVPLAAVEFPPSEDGVLHSTTNGLAAGNVLLEAILHGLYEVVERHVWSVTHARAHLRPRRLLARILGDGPRIADEMTDDPVVDEIVLPTGIHQIDALVAALDLAGISLRLLAMSEPPLPVVMLASASDAGDALSPVFVGAGSSWSPRVAAVRAITEAVQSRLVDIASAREDITAEDDPRPARNGHNRRRSRVPAGRWYASAPAARRVRLHELPDRSSPDLAVELRQLLDALAAIGVQQVAAVELSQANLPVAVARVVVPELERSILDTSVGPTIRSILDLTVSHTPSNPRPILRTLASPKEAP